MNIDPNGPDCPRCQIPVFVIRRPATPGLQVLMCAGCLETSKRLAPWPEREALAARQRQSIRDAAWWPQHAEIGEGGDRG